MDQATKTDKIATLDQTEPLRIPLLPLTGRTSKSLFTLCLSIPLARDIVVEAETENLKWYFDCPKPACHNFAD